MTDEIDLKGADKKDNKKPPEYLLPEEINIGCSYYVQFGGGSPLVIRKVTDITERTIELVDNDERIHHTSPQIERFALKDIKLIERAY